MLLVTHGWRKENKLFCCMLWAQKDKDRFIHYQTRAIWLLLHWKKHFVTAVNVVTERHKFRQRTQRTDETINQFLAALWELSAACDFGDMEEQMLCDQLVEWAASYHIRDRLLLELDLILNKAVSIAVQMETALNNSEILSDTSQVWAIQSHRNTKQLPSSSSERPVANSRQRRSCYHCGSSNHLANNLSCPATKAVCSSCGNIVHFAKVCRLSQKRVWDCHTGDHCIIHEWACDGERQNSLGCFSTDVFHDGKSAVGTLYIVMSGSPLLRTDLLKALNCRIEGDTVITNDFWIASSTYCRLCKWIHTQSEGKAGYCTCSAKIEKTTIVSETSCFWWTQNRVDVSPRVSPIVLTQKRWWNPHVYRFKGA